MNLLTVANLEEIIKCKYHGILLHSEDLYAFTNIPWHNRNWYPVRRGTYTGCRGFFNNGHTSVWADTWPFTLQPGDIKIATRPVTPQQSYWSDVFSFREEGSPLKIYKYMKLKAFW